MCAPYKTASINLRLSLINLECHHTGSAQKFTVYLNQQEQQKASMNAVVILTRVYSHRSKLVSNVSTAEYEESQNLN